MAGPVLNAQTALEKKRSISGQSATLRYPPDGYFTAAVVAVTHHR
jgi:hypothetical protein